jgi:muramoyltetrapeptide carboxypeptidase
MNKIKPHRLDPGDRVGIVSPSWGGAGRYPHRVQAGIQQLERLDYKVVLAKHALTQGGYVSDTAEHRAADIHEMFADPQVKAIIAAIGGDHSCHLLPLLDFELIKNNPKIFMGFSDITVLNLAIWSLTGLVTFNGPALLTDFAEYPNMLEYTLMYFRRTLCQTEPVGEVQAAKTWTEEFQDWGKKKDLERPRKTAPSPGWTWLKPGIGRGRLIGGCLESLEHLRGTRYWPDWEKAVFFFETSEEAPSPERVDSILMDYENMGVFDQITGLLVGRPMRYKESEKVSLRNVLLERTRKYTFPILADMDFGHTSPQFILPIGCQAEINTYENEFTIMEAAVI